MPVRLTARRLEDRVAPATFAWNVDADGDWTDPANWIAVTGGNPDGFPNAAADVAVFGTAITARRTVRVPAGATVTAGAVRIDSGTGYTLAGPGTVRLDAADDRPAVTVSAANGSAAHAITAELLLADPATVRNDTVSALTVGGRVSGPGGLTVRSASGATVRLAPAVPNTFAGPTRVTSGTLELAGPAVGVPGAVSVGTSDGPADAARLRVAAADGIGNDAAVRVLASGRLTVAAADTVAGLTVEPGGAVDATGLFRVTGPLTVNGRETADTFVITGNDDQFAGTVNGRPIGPVGVGGAISLNGRAGNDVFRFADGAGFAGTVNGGAGTDTLDYAAYTTSVTVNLGLTAPTFISDLVGDEMSDPIDTPVAGTAFGRYAPAGRTLDLNLTLRNLTPERLTNVRLVGGPIASPGFPVISLGASGATAAEDDGVRFAQAGIALAPETEALLLAGFLRVAADFTQDGTTVAVIGQLMPFGPLVVGPSAATGTGGVSGIENVTGGAAGDNLIGSVGANVLTGGGGADLLVGGPGDDRLRGGDGDDLFGQSLWDGSDRIDGGAGTDRLQLIGEPGVRDAIFLSANGTRLELSDSAEPIGQGMVQTTLDIGGVQRVAVLAGGGDDNLFVRSLDGVRGLTAFDFYGQGGNDFVDFDDGTLTPGRLSGGAGIDSLNFSAYTTGVRVNLGLGAAGGFVTELAADQPTTAAGSATLGYDPAALRFGVSLRVTGLAPAQVAGVRLGMGPAGTTPTTVFPFDRADLKADGTGFRLDRTRLALPPTAEAALLGGLAVLEVTAADGTVLRGQVLPAGPRGRFAGAVTAGGRTTPAVGFENATAGTGDDSLAGGPEARGLFGMTDSTRDGGADVFAGGGARAVVGGSGDDLFGWVPEDGSVVISGGGGTNDRVQVAGTDGADRFRVATTLFSIGSSRGGRSNFVTPVVLRDGTLDAIQIRQMQRLTVFAAGGDDTFAVDLRPPEEAGAAAPFGPLALDLIGGPGADTFDLIPQAVTTITADGGDPPPPARPGDTLTVNPAGATGFRLTTTTLASGVSGTATFADRGTITFARFETVPMSATPTVPPPPARAFLVGRGDGGQARVVNPDGTPAGDPFDALPGLAVGVRTATADFNGDGVPDLVVGTGPGSPTRVRVLDGQTRAELFTVDPFEAAFTGGVYVAVGDVTGDGVPDLVITPDEGGGPRVDVYAGAGFGKVASYFAFQDDPNFRGGARAAVGDINGDGAAEVVVSAGFGGGPRIATFDGKAVAAGGTDPARLFAVDFFAFETTLRNGAFVAVGDVDGDGRADLICGGGPGGGPRVTVFSGADRGVTLANFFAGDTDNRGGVRVAAVHLDGDDRADVLAGAGTGAGSRVTGYAGKSLATVPPPEAFALDAFPGFADGVFVG